MSDSYIDPEDRLLPFTRREQRRTDRLERAVIGYADEAGVWVPGVLTELSDWRKEEIAYRQRAEEAETAKLEALKVQDAKREKEFRYIFSAVGALITTGLANFTIISGLFANVWKWLGH